MSKDANIRIERRHDGEMSTATRGNKSSVECRGTVESGGGVIQVPAVLPDVTLGETKGGGVAGNGFVGPENSIVG